MPVLIVSFSNRLCGLVIWKQIFELNCHHILCTSCVLDHIDTPHIKATDFTSLEVNYNLVLCMFYVMY